MHIIYIHAQIYTHIYLSLGVHARSSGRRHQKTSALVTSQLAAPRGCENQWNPASKCDKRGLACRHHPQMC